MVNSMDELIIATLCKIVFFGLLLTLAALWYKRKYVKPSNETKRLHVLQSHFLSNKEKLLLVAVDQHVLLLGVTANQINVLHTSLKSKTEDTDKSTAELRPVTLQHMT